MYEYILAQTKAIILNWLALFDPTQRIYYYYLLGSLLMAFSSYQALKARSRKTSASNPHKNFLSWLPSFDI